MLRRTSCDDTQKQQIKERTESMIVVGVDKTNESKRALRWAVNEARVRHTRVQAVHAFRAPQITGRNYIPPELLEPARLQAQALKIVADTADPIARDNPDVRIDRIVCEGMPVRILCDAARHADLLVVGSRNCRRMRKLVTSSVSHKCATDAPCPIVIVA